MGFRQLHLFNLAMLAKQWWRLWRSPKTLLSRVLRARYFPSGDIFQASLRSRPSFTWRSLMAAHYLFCAGCRWRVGSGARIRAWIDPWLPRPCSFRPITPPPTGLASVCVSDLIDPVSRDWRVELVNQLFLPCDITVILAIPLSRVGDPNLLVWHYSKDGSLSVRSAYHLAVSLEDNPCSSSHVEKESSWRIPGLQAVCPFCQAEVQDGTHILVHCPFARQVWGLVQLGVDLSRGAAMGFWAGCKQSLLSWMLKRLAASSAFADQFGGFGTDEPWKVRMWNLYKSPLLPLSTLPLSSIKQQPPRRLGVLVRLHLGAPPVRCY
ncbi:UNVERIFIED_CONTAM: putative mitochondrial protein [Sesamum latifolium]|uniref:Mitochondrial protein n=1 Tax=Sesamum latifolium TaxID=2727402 RepID=A0AAW2XNY3_9LAMI